MVSIKRHGETNDRKPVGMSIKSLVSSTMRRPRGSRRSERGRFSRDAHMDSRHRTEGFDVSKMTALEGIDSLQRWRTEQLFRDNYQMLYRAAYGILRDPYDAEDVLQSVFLKLLGADFSRSFKKNTSAYLYRAAINQSLSIIRLRKRRLNSVPVEQLEALVQRDGLAEEERHHLLYKAMANLCPDAVHILHLRYFQNCSDVQIARLLRKSRGAVALRLHRSRVRLRKLMLVLIDNNNDIPGDRLFA